MGSYRKKPVVVEAVLYEGPQSLQTAHAFVQGGLSGMAAAVFGGPVYIRTLNGDVRCDPGEWIVRGVKGEFYPCRADIFAATYEPASASPPPADEGAAREALAKLVEFGDVEYPGASNRSAYVMHGMLCDRERAIGPCNCGLAEWQAALREARSLLSSPASDKEEHRNG